jgi:nucleotide-binding universal stress UspA family protein
MTVVPDFGMSIVGTYFPEDFEESMLTDTTDKLSAYMAKHIPDTVKSKQIVSHGTIYNEILDYANVNKINLIVMASHRPEFKDYLIGPNAARVMRHANCSTMIVRP